MRKVCITVAVTMSLGGVAGVGHAQTLRDTVQKLKPGEKLSIQQSPNYPATDLPETVAASDLVVEGVIAGARAQLTPDEMLVHTIYSVTITRILRSKTTVTAVPKGSLTEVQVSALGGVVDVDGREVTASNTALPAFQQGAHVVLCLVPGEHTTDPMMIVNGPYGAFLIEDGRVVSLLTGEKPLRLKYNGMELDMLRQLVQR